MKTSSKFLGEQLDFERESYLEGFIFGNPLIMAVSQDAPENLVPVYIIGRQEMIKLDKRKKGVTDLICLIWNPDLEKYELWILELKVYSNNVNDIKQLTEYLDAVYYPINEEYLNELLDRAIDMVGKSLFDKQSKIRGALCAQAFSDDVMKEMLNYNTSNDQKLVAIRVYRFPAENDAFVLVERIIGEEKSSTGGRMTFYDDIPDWESPKLDEELYKILKARKVNYPERFEQLKILMESLINEPTKVISQKEMREEWAKKGLPSTDRGWAVSQPLGYRNSSSLRQILEWDTDKGTLMKDNYRLREKKYADILKKVLNQLDI